MTLRPGAGPGDPGPVTHARRLARRCAAGDPTALGELYDLTSTGGWRVARGAGLDERRAGEVLVAAYVELWRRCADPEVARDPGRWLLVRVHAAARAEAVAA